MKSEGAMAKRVMTALLVLACLVPAVARPAERPLSKDDVTLLLIGGSTTEKLVALIEKRGVDFRMDPDLAKKFHDEGAADAVIEALQKAGEKAAPAASPPAAETPAAAATAASTAAPAQPARQPSSSSSVERKIAEVLAPDRGGEASSTTAKGGPARTVDLSDPPPDQVQRIIQEFAAKEKVFREARNNYTYHQINKVQELDPDGNVAGMYEQDWDIIYDDAGKRIEQVTYAPPDTLKGLIVTQEDLNSMRNVQPFVLTTEELPEYDVKYLGHVKVDEITAYVFNIRPKEILKGHQYFQGIVWVDDRDLQIVKSEGKPVPEVRAHKGQFNLFPRFTTYREQIDGKFWFPTFTVADDTLYFPGQPVHMKEIIRYSDYKQFKASSKVRVVVEKDTPPPEPPPGSSKSEPAKNAAAKH
jgi:hypothetical protein